VSDEKNRVEAVTPVEALAKVWAIKEKEKP